jgi:hypothetical protein
MLTYPLARAGGEGGALFKHQTMSGHFHPLDPVCGRLPKGASYVRKHSVHVFARNGVHGCMRMCIDGC